MKQVNTTTALNNPIANGKANLVKCPMVSDKVLSGVQSGTKKSLDTALTKSKTVDLMQAEGLKSFDLDLDNKANKELHDSIKGAIVKGFDLEAQALMAKEPKTLSDFEKATRRVLQQAVGSEFAYYRRALAKREEKAKVGDVEKSTPLQMYFKDLQSALDRLKTFEDVEFNLVEHKKALDKLLSDK